MRNKIFYFFILSMVAFSSCKKEECNYCNNQYYPTGTSAYITGRVVDTVTGLPMVNFIVSYITSDDHHIYGSDTTDSNGYYTLRFGWGGKYTAWGSAPDDYIDVLVSAYDNNKYGDIKFKAGLLIGNNTITLPDIFVKQVGYLKINIKDTTGINADSLVVSLVYPYLFPFMYYPYSYAHNYTFFINSPGHIIDTTIIRNVYPNQIMLLRWEYKKNSLVYKDSLLISILSYDTSVVNVFY